MLASFVFAAVLAAVAQADHRITLRNNCATTVGMTISSFPHNGVDYTGPAIPDIPAFSSQDVTVPSGYVGTVDSSFTRYQVFSQMNGRICDHPAGSGCENDCFGGIAFGEVGCSMTEWTFDSASINGNNDYDISNIQGFSVAQRIIPDSGCDTVTCTDVNCACDQAYRPSDTSGTCGGTGPVDQASRVCASSGYTVVYCP